MIDIVEPRPKENSIVPLNKNGYVRSVRSVQSALFRKDHQAGLAQRKSFAKGLFSETIRSAMAR